MWRMRRTDQFVNNFLQEMNDFGIIDHINPCVPVTSTLIVFRTRLTPWRPLPLFHSLYNQAERLHLEQRLDAVEARVSEAARNRADLSRRLAETAVEAEEAGVENQRLEHRVRVWRHH